MKINNVMKITVVSIALILFFSFPVYSASCKICGMSLNMTCTNFLYTWNAGTHATNCGIRGEMFSHYAVCNSFYAHSNNGQHEHLLHSSGSCGTNSYYGCMY